MPIQTRDINQHTISKSDGTPSPSKRKEVRQRVLLRAHIHIIRLQSDIIVSDLSRSGLRAVGDVDLRVGQTAYVSLDDLTHCAGMIRWIQDGRFGMKFSKLLDVIPDSQHVDLGNMPDHRERMPRMAANLNATLSLSSWSAAARIRNVSKNGMMIETDLPLSPDQQLLVSLSDGKILNATVKWAQGDRIGIELASPVSILQLTYGDLN